MSSEEVSVSAVSSDLLKWPACSLSLYLRFHSRCVCGQSLLWPPLQPPTPHLNTPQHLVTRAVGTPGTTSTQAHREQERRARASVLHQPKVQEENKACLPPQRVREGGGREKVWAKPSGSAGALPKPLEACDRS